MKKNTHLRTISRRNFLRNAALLSLSSSSMYSVLSGLSRVQAQTGPAEDYRALVCVFLFGGNDAFNTLVPRSLTEYDTYQATRRELAVPREELLAINPVNSVPADYGLHPNLTELQTLFESGKLSFIGNVGALVEPTTKTQFNNGSVLLPPQLFSHNDQQNYVMSLERTKPQQGWASRMADLMFDANLNQDLSMNMTLSGANTWQSGGNITPYSLNASGVETLWSFNPNSADEFERARSDLFNTLLTQNQPHLFAREYARVQTRAITLGAQVSSALAEITPLTTEFNSQSFLANNLRMVAQLLAARDTLEMRRQIFFVGIGDYDTHGDQARRHPLLMTELSQSLSAFYDALVELGLSDKVTTFTASDFGRTLTSNGDGTDHGWGGHQIVMGDHIDGGKIFGTMPELVIGSNDDIGEGRIIPTTSMDQYAATLANWFGLSASQINEIFPNLANFSSNDLGFFQN